MTFCCCDIHYTSAAVAVAIVLDVVVIGYVTVITKHVADKWATVYAVKSWLQVRHDMTTMYETVYECATSSLGEELSTRKIIGAFIITVTTSLAVYLTTAGAWDMIMLSDNHKKIYY